MSAKICLEFNLFKEAEPVGIAIPFFIVHIYTQRKKMTKFWEETMYFTNVCRVEAFYKGRRDAILAAADKAWESQAAAGRLHF